MCFRPRLLKNVLKVFLGIKKKTVYISITTTPSPHLTDSNTNINVWQANYDESWPDRHMVGPGHRLSLAVKVNPADSTIWATARPRR